MDAVDNRPPQKSPKPLKKARRKKHQADGSDTAIDRESKRILDKLHADFQEYLAQVETLGGYKDEAEAAKDRNLALNLLLGIKDGYGRRLPARRYLQYNSQEEREARIALARLLRSNVPIDKSIRRGLANLFDPPRTTRCRKREIQIKYC
jgi:hypothetical protein